MLLLLLIATINAKCENFQPATCQLLTRTIARTDFVTSYPVCVFQGKRGGGGTCSASMTGYDWMTSTISVPKMVSLSLEHILSATALRTE